MNVLWASLFLVGVFLGGYYVGSRDGERDGYGQGFNDGANSARAVLFSVDTARPSIADPSSDLLDELKHHATRWESHR